MTANAIAEQRAADAAEVVMVRCGRCDEREAEVARLSAELADARSQRDEALADLSEAQKRCEGLTDALLPHLIHG